MEKFLESIWTFRFFAFAVGTMLAWFLVWSVRWLGRHTCFFGHKSVKYLKLGYFTNYKCNEHFEVHTENEWWATVATWLCEACHKTGTTCFGTESWWKIEFGRVVPDEKAITNHPNGWKSPKVEVDERRAKKMGLTKPVRADEAMEEMVKLVGLLKEGKVKVVPVESPAPAIPPEKEVKV